ncbi:MAG: alcohol dehydrogenase catalytic domain-containing protein [Proteobacteria bacterium]|nr:alcohol dehydrogenase catalytic domain-containing protein [Pseudomonadota bacterium]
MKAALLVGPQKIEIRDLPVPVPREGEVLVRVREAGICGTDFAKYRGDLGGDFPVIAGHEAVGEIADLGLGVVGIHIGERVAIQPNFACGQCETCRSGMENICPNRVRLGLDVDGVFAEYVTAPRKYVWTLPEGLSDSVAALTEPLSIALHGFQKSAPVPTALIARKELLIQGAMTYRDEFRAAIDLLQKGEIRSDLFITNIYPLEKLPEALAGFRSPQRVKDIVKISS